MRRTLVVVSAVTVALGIAGAWLATSRQNLLPEAAQATPTPAEFGGSVRGGSDSYAGYGWSLSPDTGTAIHQAIRAARGNRNAPPQVAFLAYTVGHVPEDVSQQARQCLGPETAICGRSSDYGVITPDGYHWSSQGAVGVLLVWGRGMQVGVGGAELDDVQSAQACADKALAEAKAQAGLSFSEKPSMIITSPTANGEEEKYIAALTAATDVPILGGTAGGTAKRRALDSSTIANGRVIHKGLVLTVFHSDQPFAWAFAGGFDRTGKSGIVTASNGREVFTIDNRPALDVYDEWTGGRMKEALRAGNPNILSALYPLYRVVGDSTNSTNLFTHIWPPADSLQTGGRLVCASNLLPGDVVHFSEGSWSTLVNRVGLLPKMAMEQRPDQKFVAGIVVCCEGIIKNVPDEQRGQIAQLLNRHLGNMPWLATFTWGEQGNYHGIGNYHGNLQSSLTLIPVPEGESDR